MPTRLGTPLVNVTRTSEPDKTLEIQTTNADLVLWDRTRPKHKWPKFEDAPFLWMTFISWAAARRAGLIGPDVSYETWEADVLSVDAVDPDADDENGAAFPERVAGSADSRTGVGDADGT